MGVAGLGDPLVLRPAGGEQQDRIVGGAVGIDGNVVEAPVDRVFQEVLEHPVGDGGVGENIGQHGGHMGRDHARALGDPGDGHGRAVDVDLADEPFGNVSVVEIASAASSQLDPSSTLRPGSASVIFPTGNCSPMTPVELIITSPGAQPSTSPRRRRRRLDHRDARLAGKRIGVGRIDDQPARMAAFQDIAVPIDGRRGHGAVGKHAGNIRRLG